MVKLAPGARSQEDTRLRTLKQWKTPPHKQTPRNEAGEGGGRGTCETRVEIECAVFHLRNELPVLFPFHSCQ